MGVGWVWWGGAGWVAQMWGAWQPVRGGESVSSSLCDDWSPMTGRKPATANAVLVRPEGGNAVGSVSNPVAKEMPPTSSGRKFRP